MRLTPLLALIAAATPLAAETSGPFAHATVVADGTSAPTRLCADPAQVEFAALAGGDSYAGLIGLSAWSGQTQQAGVRAWGGNVFAGPVDRPFWIGAPTWDCLLGTKNATTGVWTYARRTQQDWHLRIGYVAATPAQLSLVNGSASVLGTALPWPQVIVELPIRFRAGGTGYPEWQLRYLAGVPTSAGVWQIPAGQSIGQAQANLANRLADLSTVLSTFSPRNGTWSMQFTVGAAGAWSLLIDKDGDRQADATLTSATAAPATVAGVTGASGQLVAVDSVTAGTNQVSRTPVTLSYFRPKPVVTFASPTFAVSEGGSPADVVLALDRPAEVAGSIVLGVASGAEQVAGLGTVAIPAGATEVDVPISAIDDAAVESEALLTLTLAGGVEVVAGPGASAVLAVQDNDAIATDTAQWVPSALPYAYDRSLRKGRVRPAFAASNLDAVTVVASDSYAAGTPIALANTFSSAAYQGIDQVTGTASGIVLEDPANPSMPVVVDLVGAGSAIIWTSRFLTDLGGGLSADVLSGFIATDDGRFLGVEAAVQPDADGELMVNAYYGAVHADIPQIRVNAPESWIDGAGFPALVYYGSVAEFRPWRINAFFDQDTGAGYRSDLDYLEFAGFFSFPPALAIDVRPLENERHGALFGDAQLAFSISSPVTYRLEYDIDGDGGVDYTELRTQLPGDPPAVVAPRFVQNVAETIDGADAYAITTVVPVSPGLAVTGPAARATTFRDALTATVAGADGIAGNTLPMALFLNRATDQSQTFALFNGLDDRTFLTPPTFESLGLINVFPGNLSVEFDLTIPVDAVPDGISSYHLFIRAEDHAQIDAGARIVVTGSAGG